VKSSVRFKSLNFFDSIFLTKKSIDLNCDWNQWFKSHWFKSANPGSWHVFLLAGLSGFMLLYTCTCST